MKQYINIYKDEKTGTVDVDINLNDGTVSDMKFLDALSQVSQQIIAKKTDVLDAIKYSVTQLSEGDEEEDSEVILSNLLSVLKGLL